MAAGGRPMPASGSSGRLRFSAITMPDCTVHRNEAFGRLVCCFLGCDRARTMKRRLRAATHEFVGSGRSLKRSTYPFRSPPSRCLMR